MGKKISNFRELRVYKTAFELQQDVFAITRRFPSEERFSLTSQIRRSSRAIGANLAEAWQKRLYPAHFTSKLTDSDAELAETRHWLDTALACEYLSSGDHADLVEKCESIGRMLGKMLSKSESFEQE